jgi:ATP-dependent helicase/nuclease subunit A
VIPPRSVLLANAGSGKTFTLANQIIRWAIERLRAGQEPEPWRILAVTFTRKAAGEILARIVAHAAMGAREDAVGVTARSDFREVIGDASAAEYQQVLEALCEGLHRMQVGTLDGFFHRVASALAAELGLPANWTIGDTPDLKALRAEAAVEVLRSDRAQELLELLEEGAPKPSVLFAIDKLLGSGSVTVLDHYLATLAGGSDAVEKAWGWAARLSARRVPRPADEFDRLADAFIHAPLPVTAGGTPHGSWVKQHEALKAQLAARDYEAIAGSGYFVAVYKNTTYYKLQPSAEANRAAIDLGEHIHDFMLKRVVQRIEGARAVLPIAAAAVDRVKEDVGLYDFGDVVRRVAAAADVPGSQVADIERLCEALGSSIEDLAIDEAQDTSVAQFGALRPLIERVLGVHDPAHSGRFLLVGDPKQSIYGWRGGVPGLIEHIKNTYAQRFEDADPLSLSYRSSKLVMDFVNRVFGDLEHDLLALVEEDLLRDSVGLVDFANEEDFDAAATTSPFKRAIAEWRFMRHQANDPKIPGRIHAYACGEEKEPKKEPKKDKKSARDPAGDSAKAEASAGAESGSKPVALKASVCAAEVAARLHAQRPGKTIAILARSNDGVADAVAHLKSLGVAASDEGRSSLLDSPAVVAMLSLVRLIDSPADRIAHFLVSHSLLAEHCGLAESEKHGSPDAAAQAAASFAAACRREIADRGLAWYLRSALTFLEAKGISERDRARAARVVSIADEFAHDPLPRLRDFLVAVEAEQASSASAHKVRVMTVHASKGLEFDEVVLMGLDGDWGATPTGWGVLALDPTTPPHMVAPLMDETTRTWVTELTLVERDERRRRVLDDLSGLYVAITRAKDGVHLVLDIQQGDKLPTGARLVLEAVDAAHGNEDALQGADSIKAAFAKAKPSSAEPFWKVEFGIIAPEAARPAAIVVPATDSLVEVVTAPGRAVPPPSMHESQLWQFNPFKNDDVALRGVLVHECFREVRTAADLSSAEARARIVAAAARRASVEKGEPVRESLQDEAVALLERVAGGAVGRELCGGGAIHVRTELPFVHETADGLVHGRIDRLELEIRDGKVVAATIIDFKTGAKYSKPVDLDNKKQGYLEQLDGYAVAVSAMFGIEQAAIRRKLLFVDRDEVVEA